MDRQVALSQRSFFFPRGNNTSEGVLRQLNTGRVCDATKSEVSLLVDPISNTTTLETVALILYYSVSVLGARVEDGKEGFLHPMHSLWILGNREQPQSTVLSALTSSAPYVTSPLPGAGRGTGVELLQKQYADMGASYAGSIPQSPNSTAFNAPLCLQLLVEWKIGCLGSETLPLALCGLGRAKYLMPTFLKINVECPT